MTAEPRTVAQVIRWIVCDPQRAIVHRWNYKSAVLSAIVRSGVFFGANLPSGADAAWSALTVEFAFRFATAGFYGALTQAFRRVEPPRTGTIAAMVVLPAVGHSMEWAVHVAAGTARLRDSIVASVLLTAVSTSFNLFAMRRGALVVGAGSQPLLRDLMALPSLIGEFIAALARSCLKSPAR